MEDFSACSQLSDSTMMHAPHPLAKMEPVTHRQSVRIRVANLMVPALEVSECAAILNSTAEGRPLKTRHTSPIHRLRKGFAT